MKTLQSILSTANSLEQTDIWLRQETFEALREEAIEMKVNAAQRIELVFTGNVVELSLSEGTIYSEGYKTTLKITLILNDRGEIYQMPDKAKFCEIF